MVAGIPAAARASAKAAPIFPAPMIPMEIVSFLCWMLDVWDQAEKPLSATISAPVTKAASGLAR
jgi:hypothetical protein